MEYIWLIYDKLGGVTIIIPEIVLIVVSIITIDTKKKSEKFKSKKEVSNDKAIRYYEYQFELYNKLWAEVYS